jgi:hypothetical protein
LSPAKYFLPFRERSSWISATAEANGKATTMLTKSVWSRRGGGGGGGGDGRTKRIVTRKRKCQQQEEEGGKLLITQPPVGVVQAIEGRQGRGPSRLWSVEVGEEIKLSESDPLCQRY